MMKELMRIFREARNEANKQGVIYEGSLDEAGLKAVLEAVAQRLEAVPANVYRVAADYVRSEAQRDCR